MYVNVDTALFSFLLLTESFVLHSKHFICLIFMFNLEPLVSLTRVFGLRKEDRVPIGNPGKWEMQTPRRKAPMGVT